MTHEELRDLLPLAALDTIEESERRDLEVHLASCATCPAELAALRDAVGWMGGAVAPIEPSVELGARIAAIPTRRQSTKKTSFRAMAVRMTGFAAAAIVAAAVMYAWGLATRVQSIEAELTSERDMARFLASADTATIVLAGTEQAPKARLKLAYDRRTGRAILFGYELPSAPEGKAYQMWFIAGGKPVPGRVFSPDSTGRGMWKEEVPPEGREASIFAVTLEPAGGVAAPTGPMVMKSVSVS